MEPYASRKYGGTHKAPLMTLDMRSLIRLVEAAAMPLAAAKPPVRRKPVGKALTDLPAFKQWFAGSKVVDARGKPLRVYHGSGRTFAAFNSGGQYSHYGDMIFFATEPSFATMYAGKVDDDVPERRPNLMPCYLRILKLFDYREHSHIARDFYNETGGVQEESDAEHIRIALYGREDTEDSDNPEIHGGEMPVKEFEDALRQGCYPALECPDFVYWLRSHGVDGMVMLEGNSVNYAVFSSRQVKSAVSNVGTFDPDSETVTEAGMAATRRT